MTRSAGICAQSMLKNGIDQVNQMNSSDWHDSEYTEHGQNTFEWLNKDILSQQRGCGYWLWKPWCIASEMLDLKDNDILVYSDAGVEWVNSVHHIIDRMDQDIFFFTNGFPHVEWCKGDVLKSILGWNIPGDGQLSHLKDFKQVQASVIVFKVNHSTRNFVKEWLLYCQMPGFIDDSPSKLPNYPTFAEHRHDQAILTCLQIKYGYKLHFWPTNYSEHIRYTAQPEDAYPVLFNHHRKRDPGKGNGDPEWPQS